MEYSAAAHSKPASYVHNRVTVIGGYDAGLNGKFSLGHSHGLQKMT